MLRLQTARVVIQGVTNLNSNGATNAGFQVDAGAIFLLASSARKQGDPVY